MTPAFDFGEIVGSEGGKLRIRPRIRVIMSLQHTKAFFEVFSETWPR
jgi:hypothetical protein